MITEPIQLLRERLKEIKEMKISAKKNKLLPMELYKLNKLYERYYASVEALSKFTDERFIDKGILYKGYVEVFRDQEREIKALKAKLSKMYRERSKDT